MRKQGHTHKPGHCITNDNQLEWRASSKLTLDDRLRMDRQGVFVCCKGYACVCMKMEEGLERCALREKKQTKKNHTCKSSSLLKFSVTTTNQVQQRNQLYR